MKQFNNSTQTSSIYYGDLSFSQGLLARNHLSYALNPLNKINLLILFHAICYITYLLLMYTGWLSSEFSGSTVNELINNSLALSSEKEALTERWTSALFTYPFIHFELGEFVLSMLMLWIFGHILSQRVGVGRVLFLYALFTILAGIAFNVSHIIFPVFSGLGGTMEGAFAPVLGIMSATAVLMNKRRLYIGSVASISLLQLYAFCLLIGLFVACKNNIAYVMAYLICIYAGLLFAIILHFKETKGLE